MWKHCLEGLEKDPFSLDRECDWVIKHNLVEKYRAKYDIPLGHPRVALLDLQYHDVSRTRGVFYKLQNAGAVERMVDDADIETRQGQPAADDAGQAARRLHPQGQGTPARLHGRLGAPEGERPGAAHGAVQGPVQVEGRPRRPPHRFALSTRAVVPRPAPSPRSSSARRGLQRVEVDGEPSYVLTAAHRRGRARRPRRDQHDRGRARPGHRWLARRALEPDATTAAHRLAAATS